MSPTSFASSPGTLTNTTPNNNYSPSSMVATLELKNSNDPCLHDSNNISANGKDEVRIEGSTTSNSIVNGTTVIEAAATVPEAETSAAPLISAINNTHGRLRELGYISRNARNRASSTSTEDYTHSLSFASYDPQTAAAVTDASAATIVRINDEDERSEYTSCLEPGVADREDDGDEDKRRGGRRQLALQQQQQQQQQQQRQQQQHPVAEQAVYEECSEPVFSCSIPDWQTFKAGAIHKNSLQLVAFTLFEWCMVSYSGLQIWQHDQLVKDIGISDELLIHLGDIKTRTILFSQFGVQVTACIGITLLTWRLYSEFGWLVFQKLGADVSLRKMMKEYRLLFTLLKLDAFFFFGYAIQIAILTDKYWQKGLTEVAFAVPLSCIIILLGFCALRNENKVTMGGFITCLALLIGYMIYRLVALFQTLTGDPATDPYFFSRKTMTVFAGLTLFMTILALINAIVMLYNFNKGLKEAMRQYRVRRSGTIRSVTHSTRRLSIHGSGSINITAFTNTSGGCNTNNNGEQCLRAEAGIEIGAGAGARTGAEDGTETGATLGSRPAMVQKKGFSFLPNLQQGSKRTVIRYDVTTTTAVPTMTERWEIE
ncbi:hypothetical protein BCR41DRAFT_367666 [Lobosporangium transversale]|uniref:TRP C-terminal domain-containing protein n=1 Tax=Lobosporangium transversale TaxID=64571 RepID=A0A1Y2GYF3_9FUNG|nr:hypothetical protein BCR41DRAFT_367666 [Lobosporangium transversale]ORZ27306.1 hypothetical protein BCR41DRAFT_367666 [Lobosporangium transversale]|eukprot:XP_021885033.1 hypothetical protein BCR41DRAFT_367666 [Lobosporangium transversale]